MRIINIKPDDKEIIRQIADLLVEGFREHSPNAWPDMDAALSEVRESFGGGSNQPGGG